MGKVSLYQNSPNPFTRNTDITMELPETANQVQVIVYDMDGTQLKAIDVKERGITKIRISGNELKHGLFLYALVVDGKVIDIKRMILTK